MKKLLVTLFLIVLSFISGWSAKSLSIRKSSVKNPNEATFPKPLEKYTIENLSGTETKEGELTIRDLIEESKNFSSYLFKFTFNPKLKENENKTITGQINFPQDEQASSNKTFPLVVMLRGYVDQKIYKTGMGTKNASKVFAENGFITIAPDFLGYAGSDAETENIFESRFQTYTTVLSLLKTLELLPQSPNLISAPSQLTNQLINQSSIFIWGHSNGGQIALTILEITGKDYPTTLWAPVSESFPYNVLFYTNEADDKGKLIRSELAKFEQTYDVEKYSQANYLERLKAPIQIHQGTNDDAIPMEWTYRFINHLKALNKDFTYYEYPGADHNLLPNWDLAVERDLEFFNSHQESQPD